MKKNNGASLIEYRAPSPITPYYLASPITSSPITFYYLVFDMRQTA